MDNTIIGLIFLDIALAMGFYHLLGPLGAVGSLIGSAIYFLLLR